MVQPSRVEAARLTVFEKVRQLLLAHVLQSGIRLVVFEEREDVVGEDVWIDLAAGAWWSWR